MLDMADLWSAYIEQILLSTNASAAARQSLLQGAAQVAYKLS